jgi:hypothetical protein
LVGWVLVITYRQDQTLQVRDLVLDLIDEMICRSSLLDLLKKNIPAINNNRLGGSWLLFSFLRVMERS